MHMHTITGFFSKVDFEINHIAYIIVKNDCYTQIIHRSSFIFCSENVSKSYIIL